MEIPPSVYMIAVTALSFMTAIRFKHFMTLSWSLVPPLFSPLVRMRNIASRSDLAMLRQLSASGSQWRCSSWHLIAWCLVTDRHREARRHSRWITLIAVWAGRACASASTSAWRGAPRPLVNGLRKSKNRGHSGRVSSRSLRRPLSNQLCRCKPKYYVRTPIDNGGRATRRR